VILKADITEPSNYRSAGHFDAWLKARGIVGLSGVDTPRIDRLDPRDTAPRTRSSRMIRPASSTSRR
jgi:carbamoyl-phosphate synthase small subunit